MATVVRRRALMVAFHYPPMRGSSGLQRTLKFSNYLHEYGWDATVITACKSAYPQITLDQMSDIGPNVCVRRGWCLDTARHLAIRGRYPRILALPDRWASWTLSALTLAWFEIRKRRPDVIWSTFPIATAQLIGACLSRITGIPWIADLRDSMTEDHYPRDENVRAMYRRIEATVVRRASAVVFTAPSTRRMYQERYPAAQHEHWHVISNGFDEENFATAEALVRPRASEEPHTLIHSGLIDPIDRDPLPFLDALSDLKAAAEIEPRRVRIILRATGHDDLYARELARRDLQDLVFLAPPLPYAEALAEMLTADGLLLFQASGCNHQIPAKLYEYFRARRPILLITDPAGDTAAEARAAGIRHIFPWDDRRALRDGIRDFVFDRLDRSVLRPREDAIVNASRKGQTALLAGVFEGVVRSRSAR
jgi:hypothetical protein